MTRTFDHKRPIKPYGIKDVDKAFTNWFIKKLSFTTTDKDGNKKTVPVTFVSFERWAIARESGIRDNNGTLILPLIAITRTKESGEKGTHTSRTFADLQQPNFLHKELDQKSSAVANLIKERSKKGDFDLDPSLPIYEVYAFDPPVHQTLTYQVDFWATYLDEVNQFIEEMEIAFNYNSVKSFQFEMNNDFYLTAFEEDEISNDSNLDDFSGAERIQRRSFVFNVSAHMIPESKNKESPIKRYWSQTRIVFTRETDD